jgi:hypothetical protein
LLSRLRTGVPAVLAMLALSAGLVTASIPNSLTGVISGCYAKSGGTLRVIDAQAGETCKKGELPVFWNQTGPPGPTGAPGEEGPPGPPGPASLTALAGTECVRQNATSGTVVVTVGNDDSVTITCEGTAPNWCLTHTPDVGAHMTVTCDESTDTLTFTCDTTWYDFNTDYTDGCEAQLEALPQTVATVQAAADYLLAGTHDFQVVADCTSLPTIACPGGIPSDPLPTVRMVGTNVLATGPDPFAFSADISLKTLQGIPISAFGLTCTLNVDTLAGANPVAHVAGTVVFSSHDDPSGVPNRLDIGTVNLTGVDDADFSVTGGLGCDFAAFGLGLLTGTITATVEAYLTNLGGLCGAPGPELFIPCP